MLLELNIENFAIIDKISISFSKGLNVMTGETGAGKSIIIDAVGTLIGGRATKEYVRSGSEKAVVEALFDIGSLTEIIKVLNDYGIDKEPDNTMLLTREIYSSGKSTTRVNGRTVTLNMLKDITNKLVDIHGQHEHQSLLSWENHILIIDSLGGSKIQEIKKNFKEGYNKLLEYKSKLNKLSYDDKERERQIDLYGFQLEEIDNAQLTSYDEEEIIKKFNTLSNTEEIIKTLANVLEVINSSDYNNRSVIDSLNHLGVQLQKVSKYDKELDSYGNIISSSIYQLQDLCGEIRSYQEKVELEYDEAKIIELEERINLINKLKRKYGNTIEEIIKYRNEISTNLDFLINSEKEIAKLKKEIEKIEEDLYSMASDLSIERQNVSSVIEKQITEELKDLNMNNVTFKSNIDKLNYFNSNGLDRLEFLISTNLGEPLKPLSKIASGGEMSRIMLAFKKILAHIDHIPCLIFDEIDTGISGRTAQIVGEKISEIARTHQVFCITHLPQIAAMADQHFLINKSIKNSKTTTNIFRLNHNEQIEELSRLLGGVNLTDTTKLHAKEMIEMSKKVKNSF